MRSAGVLLTAGLALGLAAAWVPTLGPVWNPRPPEQLELLSTRIAAWQTASALFAVGLVSALAGVLVLAGQLLAHDQALSAWAAIGTFCVGTTLWLIHLGFRMTVMVSVSRDVRDGAPMPDWFLPLWHWGNWLLAAYVLLASIGIIALGRGVLAAGLVPAWTAWTAIGLATGFILTVVVVRNTLPVFPQLATGLLGVAALLDRSP